jgi:hypothetical protein
MEVSGKLHAPAVLTAENETPEHIGWKAGWAPEAVWTLCKREKYLAPARD